MKLLRPKTAPQVDTGPQPDAPHALPADPMVDMKAAGLAAAVRSGTSGAPSDLWAITSYFNPIGYRTRRLNYHLFRERLGVPLLTVELSYGSNFDLGPADATTLIQLKSDHVMWQKERLLNLAQERLPGSCRKVVWIDCDVLFERDDWAWATSRALDHHALVQPYSTVFDLGRGSSLDEPLEPQSILARHSMAAQFAAGKTHAGPILTDMMGLYSPGHAWGIRRDVLRQTGFYDAFIVGGADNLMAQAAVGRHEELVRNFELTPQHARHTLAWADRFHRHVCGMGVVAGHLFHLWHGEFGERKYAERHQILQESQFDPDRDIVVGPGGCWRWNSNKPRLHAAVRAYFEQRKEDGA